MNFDNNNYMIVWTAAGSGPACLEVGPWPDRTCWARSFTSSTGCCDAEFEQMSGTDQAQALLNLAAQLMFQGCEPTDVLNKFARISVWRDMSVLLPSGRCDRAFIAGNMNWNPHNP